MSQAAREERAAKRRWAEPGSRHDKVVRIGKWLLPVIFLFALLTLAFFPFAERGDNSFILDKTEVDQAEERMRVERARYRGEDEEGRAFLIIAERAVQESSAVPVVMIEDMAASLSTDEGELTVLAPQGRYDIEEKMVNVPSTLRVTGTDGYRLDTSDVTLDLNTNMLRSDGRVTGEMRLGSFEASGLTADLDARTLVLSGRARLKIAQGAVR
ncbi:LPS export ABC transporter periplasmic protein LptC [Sphingomicrobium sediminis]|uniref:LPS export ABC transporter periplasmic protein LptC n=1 Tax=Sphingomicrobium sediminis TaxID=2950949 RepID=A0A9X2J2D1_9SPHN|nr:LPS export ABC transporter periplasmic protein LptC [Sphingomicrobium sediminis]